MEKDRRILLSRWYLYFTPQERLVLGILCAVIFLGSVLRYGFTRIPNTMAKMEYIASQSWQGKLNINMASEEELQNVPYIGKAMARRIVAYREEHGPFVDTSELTMVKGMGEANLRAVEPFVAVE
jgi:competence ComEA-like helix-hairpin-helix protein